MTSIAASLSVDARGPCALYIITDSRITWETSATRWDASQKAFASRVSPDIFGFCGDAYFPAMILHQVLEQINSRLVFDSSHQAIDRHQLLVAAFKTAIEKRGGAPPMRKFAIFHGARDTEFMESRFYLWKTEYYVQADRWFDSALDLNESKSYLASIDGTGRNAIENRADVWANTEVGGTSRAAIWSFCESLSMDKDPFSGGAPQLVGIWRKGPAQNFGFIWQGKRFLAGLEVQHSALLGNTLWFNSAFERCDSETGERLREAQAHQKPQFGPYTVEIQPNLVTGDERESREDD